MSMQIKRMASSSAALLVVLSAIGCSDDETEKKDAGGGATTDGGDLDGVVDGGPTDVAEVADGSGDGATPDAGLTDTGAGDKDLNAPVDVPVDVGPECQVAADCSGVVTPLACEELACTDGLCAAVLKTGSCCENKHCDDKVDCTEDVCNVASHTCTNKPIPNCCSGKLTLMKGKFEAGAWEDVVPKEGPGNGNVKWQLTDKRAHGGKSSLYFGNECGTYDNGMTAEGSCIAEPDKASAVSTVLSSKAFLLPEDKQTQLHFWLWLDAEPSYSTSLPKGDCAAAPCKVGSSCVSVSGKSQCIPEKDVFTVQVLSSKSGLSKVFDATTIGKSTAGKWQRIAVDLAAFKGETVTLQWLFSTGTALKNGFEGVYLDDIVLETVCALEGTLCAADKPCLDDNNVCTDDGCSAYVNAPQSGVCFHDTKPDCCAADGDCGDGNDCTTDACVDAKCQYSPDASKPGCCKKSVLAVDDFESGVLDQWTLVGGNSNVVKWRIDPKGGSNESQALYFGNANHDGYADADLNDGGPKGMACINPVQLSKGTVFNLVTFKLRMETEWSYLPKGQYKNPPLAGKPKFDHFSVQVEADGKQAIAWSSDMIYGTTEGKWVEVVVPIDQWQGQKATVCVSFDAGDNKVNDNMGVHIDEFAIKVACDKLPCYFDGECGGECPSCQAPGCTPTGCKCVDVPGCCLINDDCDDSNPCTKEFCNAGTCKVDKVDNCCQEDAECVSQDACETSVCDKSTGKCAQIPIAACCKEDKDCDDQDACTKDTCDIPKSACVHDKIEGC